MSFDKHPELQSKIEEAIRNKALPWLQKFIQIPNLSRNFDPEWSTNGLLEKAIDLCLEYAKQSNIKGLNLKYYRDEGKTPILFGTIDSTREGLSQKSIMVYGHLDKQPHLTEGWDAGLGPVDPVIKNGLLYGRGGVDDGYNFFTILAIVEVFQQLGIPHDRIVLFYECDEESSSRDVPHYLQKFEAEIGEPNILFCLDSGSLSNQYFALTTTLRGCLAFDLKVRVLEKSMHSGVGSGIVPSTFRILFARICRDLLERIECSKTGMIIDNLQVQIPPDKLAQVDTAVKIQGDGVHSSFCFCQGVKPVVADNKELYINNVWRSQLEIIGQKGIPLLHESGNVLREETILRGSLRLPPTLNTAQAAATVKEVLEKDPPYGAHVSVDVFKRSPGWNANAIPDNVMEILDKHNKELFGNPTFLYGMGGSIPFINTMQDKMPKTLFFVSGLVLPDSAIHGPNESLDIEYWVKFSKYLIDLHANNQTPSLSAVS